MFNAKNKNQKLRSNMAALNVNEKICCDLVSNESGFGMYYLNGKYVNQIVASQFSEKKRCYYLVWLLLNIEVCY